MEICNNCGVNIQNQNKIINNLIVCESCFLALQNVSIGLGDTIEKITHATGLDVVAKTVANSLGFEDCGCGDATKGRHKQLNDLFPYSKKNQENNDTENTGK